MAHALLISFSETIGSIMIVFTKSSMERENLLFCYSCIYFFKSVDVCSKNR